MPKFTDIDKENQLLIDFLEGDAVAHDEFPERMMPQLLRTARAIARDLPEDIHQEITQQTFLNLLFTPPDKFNPARGTAWQFLIGQILNAEKQIRASYGFPQRRKSKIIEKKEDFIISEKIPIVVSINDCDTMSLPTTNFERTFESEFFVKTVISQAPTPLTSALKLICYQDKTKAASAKTIGLSRFQMRRQILNLRSRLMAA